MKFNVAQLLKAAVGNTRAYDINEDIGELLDVTATRPLTGTVRFVRMPSTVLVEARLKTEVVLTCSRCIEETTQPLTIRFAEEYEPTIDVDTGIAVANEGDRDRFRIDENHILDVSEAVREYGLLALPMQPICRPECRGLCPECGQNLNLAECRCSSKAVDSRLAALQELFRDEQRFG